ncbi:hypothetical protein ACFQV2_18870 [Actinokineospora soli]|uniref:Uncharacterized protein n=1 Tax=Actinokineospora soli TaxID=1048753 RepID=A0ABW2TR34_9PSEU
MCIQVRVAQDPSPPPDYGDCVYTRPDPPQVERGGVLIVYLSNLNCDLPTEPSTLPSSTEPESVSQQPTATEEPSSPAPPDSEPPP